MHEKHRLAHRALLAAFALLTPQAFAGEAALAAAAEAETECTVKCSRSGSWHVAESASFPACSREASAVAISLARTAERLQKRLQLKWLGEESTAAWRAKCHIVVHPNLQSYVSACGRGSEHTVASSLVKTGDGKIQGRR